MLLSIVPLSIAPLLNEEKNTIITEGVSSRKQSLVACLQSLKQFASLLQPPQSVVSAANDAATKAVIVVLDFKQASGSLTIPPNCSRKAVGNLLHLVVESCIAKDLIDTTAYFWPGYVVSCDVIKDSNSTPIQECPWLKFMQEAPFTMSLQNALMVIPVPSVIELKKLYHLALHGSEEERSAAPKILCGASLIQGWTIQEHVVHAIVKLLSPQLPLNAPVTGDANLYLGHMHMLTALLSCLSNYSVIQTLALYGMIPEVVAALMPLCEAFGSFPPPSTNQSSTREEVSAYSVFSFAFLFLLRLCKFHGPDRAIHPYSCGGPVRPDLKLDFHLLMRNSRIRKAGTPSMKYYMSNVVDSYLDLRRHLVYVDSFPKLRAWYFENEACSTPDISDKCNPSRMHQASNKILNFVCRNMNKANWTVTGSGGGSSTNTSTSSSTFHSSSSASSSSGSFGSTSEDKYQGLPLYPAWELLEALPLVLDAMLSACAFGTISSRDLVTGLIDLVEFFPASIAAIIRYFKSEISRGTWKSVPMNGTDWPSPGEALYSLELEVKEVLERLGVHIENCYPHNAHPMLPLPLAAFLSLTITFRLDKNSGYTRGVISQAISNYAIISPWPIMLTIGGIWTKKAPRWHDFLVYLGARCRFTNDKGAIDQLLWRCFKSFLGPTYEDSNYMTPTRGVIGLLGESVCNSHAMSPGSLFFCTSQVYHAPHYFSELILKLVVELSCELAEWTLRGSAQLKFGKISLATAICSVHQVAMLGATLLCVTGRSPLVRVLFAEVVPIFLLSKREERSKQMTFICNILEGYALSYLLFFSAALMFGVRARLAPDKSRNSEICPHVIARHLSFIARVTEGNVVLRCDPAMWKAHVSSFLGLIVKFSPAWLSVTKLDILKKLSSCLRGWHEHDLAFCLLELGGTCAIETALESLL
ncbi:Mediator of RNA polymerase II transcription subunit 33A [Rhynchospora pubera]|uniref:Mediator of RNA polymerase II transcription subunit 33A n=1 Tax=Rhynchospora pubera TaxID=906938 RepID=A0AAV8GST7_9POAL|nr:Mediator of RNA polymerase II transcription subunit 33A [Rhynchospora pubera]